MCDVRKLQPSVIVLFSDGAERERETETDRGGGNVAIAMRKRTKRVRSVISVQIFRLHFEGYTGCFKKSFTTLKAYRNLYRGHTQRFFNCQNVAKHTVFYLG